MASEMRSRMTEVFNLISPNLHNIIARIARRKAMRMKNWPKPANNLIINWEWSAKLRRQTSSWSRATNWISKLDGSTKFSAAQCAVRVSKNSATAKTTFLCISNKGRTNAASAASASPSTATCKGTSWWEYVSGASNGEFRRSSNYCSRCSEKVGHIDHNWSSIGDDVMLRASKAQ